MMDSNTNWLWPGLLHKADLPGLTSRSFSGATMYAIDYLRSCGDNPPSYEIEDHGFKGRGAYEDVFEERRAASKARANAIAVKAVVEMRLKAPAP